MRLFPVPILFAFILPAYALEDFDKQQIIERIKPVGRVRIEGKSGTSVPEVTVSQPVAKKLPGQETYENHCTVCHATGIAGAPKFQDSTDWSPRLAKQNIDELVATAIKGLNAMPPKGTCGECSDEEIKNAVQFMLPKK